MANHNRPLSTFQGSPMTEDLKILGRHIGTHDGWDQADTDVFIFYAFIPVDGCILREGDLSFDMTRGTFTYHLDDGTEQYNYDCLDVIRNLPKVVI